MNYLQFDFTVDKAARTAYITKEFNAELPLVWDAFTTQEILDQWWAPKPLMSKTKAMDFDVGGRRFYAMVSPEGEEIAWEIQCYTSISPKSNFKFFSVFTDKDENPDLDQANWDLNFKAQSDRPDAPMGRGLTKLSITIQFNSLEHLEKMIGMGFKEGFIMTLNELETLIKK